MSLPVSQPLPPPPGSGPRLRGRRPSGRAAAGQSGLVSELLQALTPQPSGLLISLLSALLFAAALAADAPALALLALFCQPFLGSFYRLILACMVPSPREALTSFLWLAAKALAWLFAGALAGTLIISRGIALPSQLPRLFGPAWALAILGVFGAVWGTLRQVRFPRMTPRTGSLALGSALFPWLGLAGLALGTHQAALLRSALSAAGLVFLICLAAGAISYRAAGIIPRGQAGLAVSIVFIAAGFAGLFQLVINPLLSRRVNLTEPLQPLVTPARTSPASTATELFATDTPEPSPTATPSPRPSETASPSRTPTFTLTPALPRAVVSAGNSGGLKLRSDPGFDAPALTVVSNGIEVELMPDRESSGGEEWVKVRLESGQEGWMAARYLRPKP